MTRALIEIHEKNVGIFQVFDLFEVKTKTVFVV